MLSHKLPQVAAAAIRVANSAYGPATGIGSFFMGGTDSRPLLFPPLQNGPHPCLQGHPHRHRRDAARYSKFAAAAAEFRRVKQKTRRDCSRRVLVRRRPAGRGLCPAVVSRGPGSSDRDGHWYGTSGAHEGNGNRRARCCRCRVAERTAARRTAGYRTEDCTRRADYKKGADYGKGAGRSRSRKWASGRSGRW